MAARTYTVVAPTDAALPPPPGVVPDFTDPFSLRPYTNVSVSLGMVFVGVFLIARLYTKACIVKKFRPEDYTCILGFICYCGWTASKIELAFHGAGTHQCNLTQSQVSQQRRYTNYSDILYSLIACFTKLSIILLVQRIFCPQARDPCYWTLQALNVLNVCFYICYFIIPFAQCIPREKIWHQDIPGKCLQIPILYTFSAVFNTLSDMAMLFVPLWRIWNLNITRSRKIGISSIFFLGSLATAASVLRLVYVVFLFRAVNWSYSKDQSATWADAEVSLGLICSCLYVLPRLYRHLASIPPFGSDEYDDYQRRKGSTTWIDNQGRSSRRKMSTRELKRDMDVPGGIDADIDKPTVPLKDWAESEGNRSSHDSPRSLHLPLQSHQANHHYDLVHAV